MSLLNNPIFLLLLVVVLGEMLGKVRLWNLSLGPSAIIFVALGFGHYGFTLPEEVQTLGLAMFIYAIGLQSGPGFVSSFRRHGLVMVLAVFIMTLVGIAVTYACCRLFGFDAGIGAGLLSGAMTSTPSLATAVELLGPDKAPAAYGVTYGIGVIGVALCVKLLPKLLRVDISAEEQRLEQELAAINPPITYQHIEVSNPNIFGRRVADLYLKSIAPVTITRLLRRGADEPVLVGADTTLNEGDHLRVVGRPADLEKIQLYIGRPIEGEIAFDRVLTKKDIVVSKPHFAGATLGFFNFREVFNVQIARITRNGVDLPADANTRLHLGDVLHAVGDERSLRNIARIVGNDLKATYDINLLPILLGLLLGILLGRITLPLPILGPFTLGTTGGALLAGLLLGARYQTGRLIWEIPTTGNRLIRDLGLALFMAAVGTSAGVTFVPTLQAYGLPLVVSGILVTLLPILVGMAVGLWLLRIRFLRMLGVMVGAMTSVSGLSAAATLSPTPYAPSAYATVYPVALISKILAVKVLFLLL
ncbi:putative transport protein [Geoalkalibacter ferrihydriticus]|uniref:Transporter n=2 Tax=Geoalkalibacter ferrihydriticus TaxID=392333 RepID=A0A0C2HV59_9BACT|nr:TrkA C-terminal domain-containing protein [Geoalkalibacter ferrihydriticus]KIH76662.1 transporter [Geoalkalibacter ferrihydriticus DSM 17813]SDM05497.1 putative transport protein [Geoalkalibacter ferrihydriticus]